jgi:hypothetical protein
MKYNIEGDIDFYSELYKSLDVPCCNTDADLCLITSQPLTEHYVTLECGHKFNYVPLFNDIKNHKQKFNGMESTATHLTHNEIRCPYCRNKTTILLPYYDDIGLPKLHGINCIDPNFKSIDTSVYFKKCEFLIPNPIYEPESTDAKLKNPHLKCITMGTQIDYCNGTLSGFNYGDAKYYCWTHKKDMIKIYKKELKDKAKLAEKASKIAAKQLLKEEQLAAKIANEIANKIANKTINTSNTSNTSNICNELLKSGTNKGNVCGCKAFENNKCKRHHKIAISDNQSLLIVTDVS